MQIHLSKPGGQQEGPFTLERIKQDLAAKKYRDTDFWAWHEGLTGWVPLYELPGIAEPVAAAPAEKATTAPAPAATPPPTKMPPPAPAAAATPAPTQPPAPAKLPPQAPEPPKFSPIELPPEFRRPVASGLPPAALEQIFLFTTGDGQSVRQSPTTIRMLQEIIGADVRALPQKIPRDVVGQCAVGDLFRRDGAVSEAVWSAMTSHQPEIVQQARKGLYQLCTRTFRVEGDTVAALVLFYNKAKLPAELIQPAKRSARPGK